VLAELIKLTTSDGLQHFGAIYHARDYTSRAEKPVGVVLVHGYTGTFTGEVEGALPPMLAAAGYTTLVANNRGAGILGAARERFEGCVPDIRAAIDLMADRGYGRIILLGHSKGGVKAAYYLAQTGDPRVIALGLLSPASGAREIGDLNRRLIGGDQSDAWYEEVERIVAAGQEEALYAMPTWPYLATAGMIVDHARRRDADLAALLPGFNLPVLAMCGGAELNWCVVVANLKKQPPAGYTVRTVRGADHVYAAKEKELGRAVVRWLNGLEAG